MRDVYLVLVNTLVGSTTSQSKIAHHVQKTTPYKCGIARQKTTPYTPQQNGVAERMNKTLMERERSMLSGVGLG